MTTPTTTRDETTVPYLLTTSNTATENPTEATSSSTSNPPGLSTIPTTQRIDDHTAHQTTSIEKTATLLITTGSMGKN